MADPTLVHSGSSTTLTFRPGQFVVTQIPDEARQRAQVSTSGKVRVVDVSGVADRMITVSIRELPESDESDGGTTYAGRDTLRDFIRNTLNYRAETCELTDADGDTFTVRYWSSRFDLQEIRQQVWQGELPFRVEV